MLFLIGRRCENRLVTTSIHCLHFFTSNGVDGREENSCGFVSRFFWLLFLLVTWKETADHNLVKSQVIISFIRTFFLNTNQRLQPKH